VIGFANVVAAQLSGDQMNFALVCFIVAVLSAGIGAFNGALSSSLAIHPLIVTLGVGTTVQGIVLLWTGGLPTGSAPAALTEFVSIGGSVGPLPTPWLIPSFFVVATALVILLARTPFGRQLYALGSNPTAAPLALINVRAMWTITYALSALFAASAGILLLGFTGSAYGDVGQPYLFQTVAAVVIGGTTLVGGRGGLVGTIAGGCTDRNQYAPDWSWPRALGGRGDARNHHHPACFSLWPRAARKRNDLTPETNRDSSRWRSRRVRASMHAPSCGCRRCNQRPLPRPVAA